MCLSIWQRDPSTVETCHLEVFASSIKKKVSFTVFSRIDAIQGQPDYGTSTTEPISLNLLNNRNIPGACNGLVWEMFCKFCQNHGVVHMVAKIRNE